MSSIPRKEHKLIRGLSDYLRKCIKEPIINRRDIERLIDRNTSVFIWGNLINWDAFITLTENKPDDFWERLIQSVNTKIKEEIEIEKDEKLAYNKLIEMIEKDNFLKEHNIGIADIAEVDKNYYVVKVYLVCGGYMLEGTLNEILSIIRSELKHCKVIIRSYCPFCTNKQLRYMDQAALCLSCGTAFEVDTGNILKQYPDHEKDFWGAKFMADFHDFD
jgi:hypothetical protein